MQHCMSATNHTMAATSHQGAAQIDLGRGGIKPLPPPPSPPPQILPLYTSVTYCLVNEGTSLKLVATC